MALDPASFVSLLANAGGLGALVYVLLQRDKEDRAERKAREEREAIEREKRLGADIAGTAATAAMTEVLRGVAEAVAKIGK